MSSIGSFIFVYCLKNRHSPETFVRITKSYFKKLFLYHPQGISVKAIFVVSPKKYAVYNYPGIDKDAA